MGPSEALLVCWGRLFCFDISLSASGIAGKFACTDRSRSTISTIAVIGETLRITLQSSANSLAFRLARSSGHNYLTCAL